MDSIGYYNKNPKDFFDRTINADVQNLYQVFLNHLPSKARILDAGCGVGRDSRFFLSKGYDVVPLDGSIEMVKLASDLLGKPVLHMLFQDIHFSQEFDAIWANASLLHVPYDNLREILCTFHTALRSSGILFASFKYGNTMRTTEDRFFFDMTEATILPYLHNLFHPIHIWKSGDTRSQIAPSSDKSWLNVIAKRIEL